MHSKQPVLVTQESKQILTMRQQQQLRLNAVVCKVQNGTMGTGGKFQTAN